MTFKQLNDKEHVLLRPSMFIGSVSTSEFKGYVGGQIQTLQLVPGLLKIINEIIDNSIDEHIRTNGKFANKIEVSISEDEFGQNITIKDNGRGIPIIEHNGSYQPVLSWTMPRTGTNFEDNRVTMGMNGYGSCLTNFFSKRFIGTTCDSKNKLHLICNGDDENIVNVTEIKSKGFTEVTFYPEFSHFETDSIDKDHRASIKDRLENLAIAFPKITFSFNVNLPEEASSFIITKKTERELRNIYGPSTIVDQSENMLLLMTNSGESEEFLHLSYATGLHLSEGGSHIEYIMYRFCEELKVHIKKKHKIDILPNQIKQHISLITYMTNFPDMKFESQSKQRLTNGRKEISDFLNIDFEKLAKDAISNSDLIDPIISAILFKKQQQEALALSRAAKKNKVKIVPGYISASSNDSSKKRLFITEGESAIGPLIDVRNPLFDGGYPLKGKVLNALKASNADILNNVEYADLMNIIGLELGKPVDFDNIKYKSIMIMTDADVDGQSILCHLINFFAKWPELIQNGFIKRVITPLYICRKLGKNKTILKELVFYTTEEFNAAQDTGKFDNTWLIKYNKGLGSLDIQTYGDIVKDTKFDAVEWEDSAPEWLNMAFGNDAGLRKSWLIGEDV